MRDENCKFSCISVSGHYYTLILLMNRLPDPSFFLQLSESFIKAARLVNDGDTPKLCDLREISSAELATQPNPIVQVAGDGHEIPVPVATTLSLGETVYKSHPFEQIGFSTLTEFISGEGKLHQFELGVFQKADGMPAPTASPAALELVFCGFNANAIPEISDAFPNLDAKPTSITLAALDQFRFLKSQCQEDEQILLVEIADEMTHLFLIGSDGLIEIHQVGIGRTGLFETMAEVLHLHYIGSAIKLFTRSGFDSSELAPRLGDVFGNAIREGLEAKGWTPGRVQITGLLRAQAWFQEAIVKVLGIETFKLDPGKLPFQIDSSIGELSPMDTELIAKIYTSLVSDEDFSWHNDYLGSLSKSESIPRREAAGSNPPFPTAHPDRLPEISTPSVAVPPPAPEQPIPEEEIPYTPSEPAPAPVPAEVTATTETQASKPYVPQQVEAIPDHLLSDIEEYEGEFEEVDDFGGGTARFLLKCALLLVCMAAVGILVMVVFFPEASDKYLGIRPPHIDFDKDDPARLQAQFPDESNSPSLSLGVSDADVASGVQDLRDQRETKSFGGLLMQTTPNGATVLIGDMEPMQSPIKLPNIEPGTYDVIVSLDGYQTQTLTITIEPKQVLTENVRLDRLQ